MNAKCASIGAEPIQFVLYASEKQSFYMTALCDDNCRNDDRHDGGVA
jgi:hypothetical protein